MERQKSAGQKRQAVLQFLDDHSAIFCRQGAVRETWRTYRGRRAGPFYELCYREGRRLRSLYLGRSPDLAEEVRSRLRQMQAARRERRQWDLLGKRQRAVGCQLKANLSRELERLGLRLQGYEVRGMRGARL